MASPSWTPLWSSIVGSSLWDEEDCVVKVYLTMLAKKGADDIYTGSAYQLGVDSRKTELEVLDALKVLAAPDTKRIEKQEFDGRRIKAVKGGWMILNGEKYRERMREEMKKARNVRAQQAYRERQREKERLAELYRDGGTPMNGEVAYVEGLKRDSVDHEPQDENEQTQVNANGSDGVVSEVSAVGPLEEVAAGEAVGGGVEVREMPVGDGDS